MTPVPSLVAFGTCMSRVTRSLLSKQVASRTCSSPSRCPCAFDGEWARATFKPSGCLSLVLSKPLSLPPGNTTHGWRTAPGINGHPPGTDLQGWEGREFYSHFLTLGTISAPSQSRCASCDPGVWAPASLKLRSLGSIPAAATTAYARRAHGLPGLGHPSGPGRESPSSPSSAGRGTGWVLGPSLCFVWPPSPGPGAQAFRPA